MARYLPHLIAHSWLLVCFKDLGSLSLVLDCLLALKTSALYLQLVIARSWLLNRFKRPPLIITYSWLLLITILYEIFFSFANGRAFAISNFLWLFVYLRTFPEREMQIFVIYIWFLNCSDFAAVFLVWFVNFFTLTFTLRLGWLMLA